MKKKSFYFLIVLALTTWSLWAFAEVNLDQPFNCHNIRVNPAYKRLLLGRVNFRSERRLTLLDGFGRTVDQIYPVCANLESQYLCEWGAGGEFLLDKTTFKDVGSYYTADAQLRVPFRGGTSFLECHIPK